MFNDFRYHQRTFAPVLADITQRPVPNHPVAEIAQRLTYAGGQIIECVECYMLLPSPAWPHFCADTFNDDGYTSEDIDDMEDIEL